MKYPKLVTGLLLFFSTSLSLFAQDSPTPPSPGRAPGPPGEGVPIDQGIWIMLIAAVCLGVYFIFKQNDITIKSLLPQKIKKL